MEATDSALARMIQQGDAAAFEKVFSTYYKALHAYAHRITGETGGAEEIVQEVFFKVWMHKEKLNIRSSLKAYLYAAVYNESVDYLKRSKKSIVDTLPEELRGSGNAGSSIELKQVETAFQQALNHLPEQCRTVFQLSRFEDLKYRDIALQLGLSVKTVEAQMGKALKRLRIELAEFLTVLMLLLLLLWM